MKQVLRFLLFLILLVTIVAECEKDGDCESGEYCESETGNCEVKTTSTPERHKRKVEMCFHDGHCPSRFRTTVDNSVTFACCVCTENYYKTDLYSKCSNIFRGKKEKNNKIHTICQKCLVMATLPEHVNLDQQGRGVKCPTGDCENLLLMSEVQDFMEERHKEQLLDRIGSLSLAAADIPLLIRCQNCSFPVIADNGKNYYRCPECKRSNCKNCDREYIDDHEGRTCQELIQYEKKVKDRAKAANKVDEIAVHRCHRCNLQFIKDGGCNKMTCSCGATQCYFCRAKGIDYKHFGEEKAWQLFSDADIIEQEGIREMKIY
ncbi:hypothetical protein FO519_000079 [Halicephalobus sp. NKZ332]|nr:hypothetical protein FO519_000079 [Halicephalobus sp. NKZ332]